jgi:hypothetical protein
MGGVGSFVSGALGIGSSIFGAANAGSAQKAAAAAARTEAAIARQNAVDSFRKGSAQELMQRRQARSEMGNLTTGILENGLDLSSGTGADLVYDSARNQELDALNIRHSAITTMNAYKQQALLKDYEAATAQAAAKQAQIGAWMGAAGNIIGSAGSMFDSAKSLFGGGGAGGSDADGGMSSAWGDSSGSTPKSNYANNYQSSSWSSSGKGLGPKMHEVKFKVRE